MEQFVRVRIIKANDLDLAQFQFDWDLTFAAFFMNADGTLYGRFGTRSSATDASRDISIDGFQKALQGALDLHQAYPANKSSLTGKRGSTPAFRKPGDFPSLQGKYQPTLDYADNPVKSCVHCHMIGEASRLVPRSQGKSIPDHLLYPWPMPAVLGLELDPREKARITRVEPGSAAAKAGLQTGDDILSIEQQPILSIADVQWTLHNSPEPARLRTVVKRNNRNVPLTLTLDPGWRRSSDISWRATTWDLRRMATGGLKMEPLDPQGRAAANLTPNTLALRVQHVGQYGEHATAKHAGFQKDDIVVAWDGRTGPMTESEAITHITRNRMAGSTIPVTVLRGTKRIEMKLDMK